MLETGYIMLQIRMLIQALLKLLTGKTAGEQEPMSVETAWTGEELPPLMLAQTGRICEGEDLLFSRMEEHPGDRGLLREALAFYEYLAGQEESLLAEGNFSHEEILEGLQDVAALYGQGTLANVIGEDR